jgi:glycosyltransferase involved in cell wall biosynthesis
MTTRIVLLESNPFASRLHVLAPLLQSARRVADEVVMIHPHRVVDQHWEEWAAANGAFTRIVPVPTQARMLYGDAVGSDRFLALLRAAASEIDGETTLVITALDDVMREFLVGFHHFRQLARKARKTFVVKYRVEDVFGRPKTLRGWVAKFTTLLATSPPRTRLITFDERLAGHSEVVVVPDPWNGDFGAVSQQEARREMQIAADVPMVGLIGRQDRRKGFPIAVEALVRIAESGKPVGALLLGAVPAVHEPDLARLRRILGPRLIHEPSFVPDVDLPKFFAACDVIWLPYDTSFTASSGVLARAAASGVPVIASDHGLVAHRVKSNRLGWVFPAADSEQLADITSSAVWRSGTGGANDLETGSFDLTTAQGWARRCTAGAMVDDVVKIFAQ